MDDFLDQRRGRGSATHRTDFSAAAPVRPSAGRHSVPQAKTTGVKKPSQTAGYQTGAPKDTLNTHPEVSNPKKTSIVANQRVIRGFWAHTRGSRTARRVKGLFGAIRPASRKYPWAHRLSWGFLAVFMLGFALLGPFEAWHTQETYTMSDASKSILPTPNSAMGNVLKYSQKSGGYEYNKGYQPGQGTTGQIAGPKFLATFSDKGGTTITDPVTSTSISFTPTFPVQAPQKTQNQLVYPLPGGVAKKVYTLGASVLKEDIVLEKPDQDTAEYGYKLDLPNGTEARLETNGSLAIYGVDSQLLGTISAGSTSDQKLLDSARKNGAKNTLLFTFPAPFIRQLNNKPTTASAWFTLRGDILTLHAKNLKEASYPLSIDPSVYVETARKLMRGNNETNIEFDIDNQLIQKSQTTGARINAWQGTDTLAAPTWDQATAAAGGYIYSVGGQEVYKRSYTSAGSASFVVPNGVTAITVKSWGAGGGAGGGGTGAGGGAGGGGGYVTAVIPVTPNETLTLAVGGGGSGGSYTSSGAGGGGGGYTQVFRGTTPLLIAAGGAGGGGGRTTTAGGAGGAGGGTSGLAGNGVSSITAGGGGTPSAGGTAGGGGNNTATAGSSLNGGDGADGRSSQGADGGAANGGSPGGANGGRQNVNQTRAGGGGGGGGYFGGGGGGATTNTSGRAGAGGGGGSSYTDAGASAVTNTAGSGATPGNSGDTDRVGAGTGGSGASASAGSAGSDGKMIITWGGGNVTSKKVYWAQFDGATKSIVSPNPGQGACAGWCNDPAYDLPVARRGLSLVAYNGFLYAIGGTDGSTRQSTIYIAKLGANGEPQLWHPTDKNKANWTYWYQDAGLNGGTARSYLGAYAYNNRLYVLGGQTNASAGGTNTVEMADMKPMGTLSAWTTTGTQTMPNVRFGHAVHAYNDTLYIIGGNSNGTMLNTTYYSKLNPDGTMNPWVQSSSFATGRASMGGTMTTVWGAYIYMAGGCSAVNASGYCTAIQSDVQLASINADGSLAEWNSINNLTNPRIGYQLLSWQGGLYRIGGCQAQNVTTGQCDDTLDAIEYGVINPSGDASTVSNSSPSGTAPCNGAAPVNCDLPPAGTGSGQGGQMSSMVVINNGYIYNIGGCVDGTSSCGFSMSGNVSYAALNSDGNLAKPATCTGTYYGLWCVDSTNRINGTNGLGAAGATVFNNVIYVGGGTDSSNWQSNIWRVGLNANGTLTGGWTTQSFSSLGMTGTAANAKGYLYMFSRANAPAASTSPGNLYLMGGCSGTGGIGCSNYYSDVVKCNISTTGVVSACSPTGQLQIDADDQTAGNQGLGLMAGTVYANRLYLVGGSCAATGAANNPCGSNYAANRKDTIYARIDSSNNIVPESGTTWKFASAQMNPVRRRAMSFGYNGYIYSLAGYSGTASLQDLLFSKIDVSTGDMSPWSSSGVVVTPRWDLRAIVSNGYVYAIGGCTDGAAPGGCTAMQPQIQTFQLYNNDSGAPAGYSATGTCGAGPCSTAGGVDRIGVSATVMNGNIYYAGGCSDMACTTVSNTVYYAPLDPTGNIGTWTATNALPGARAWGKLLNTGGSLYYVGGQSGSANSTAQSSIYYASVSGGVPTWSTAANGLPAARTEIGATVWNDRMYVIGGYSTGGAVQTAIYISPQQNNGGDISSAWTTSGTSLAVPRAGPTVVSYANNLYVFGGYDGANYLNDAQFAQIFSNGTVSGLSDTTSLPMRLRNADGFAANGYLYILGGRSATTTCAPSTLITPISANTTIASGNAPTGIGEWYETNKQYTGDRYGAAAVYANGRAYVLGGGCSSFVAAADRTYQTTLKSQPQVAKYSRLIDTDTDVFPTKWLMNGLDNSTGARWYLRYRSMTDPQAVAGRECVLPAMTTWGQDTNYGQVTLGTPGPYTPKSGTGTNTNCARYFYFSVNIDSSQAFGYPEDVTRGPTIDDLSLFFTADPGKRMIHGKTFTGGEQQPLDTPF